MVFSGELTEAVRAEFEKQTSQYSGQKFWAELCTGERHDFCPVLRCPKCSFRTLSILMDRKKRHFGACSRTKHAMEFIPWFLTLDNYRLTSAIYRTKRLYQLEGSRFALEQMHVGTIVACQILERCGFDSVYLATLVEITEPGIKRLKARLETNDTDYVKRTAELRWKEVKKEKPKGDKNE